MLEIFKYSAGCVLWGGLIGLFCITLFFVIIKGWWKDARFGSSSYIIGIILGFILIYQSIKICGAIVAIKGANLCEPVLTELATQYSDDAEKIMTPEESDRVFNNFVSVNPFIAHYINRSEFEGKTPRELPHAIVCEIKSNMGWFIFRRILWSLGLTVLSSVLVIKSMSRKYSSEERSRTRFSRTTRARVSRRKR